MTISHSEFEALVLYCVQGGEGSCSLEVIEDMCAHVQGGCLECQAEEKEPSACADAVPKLVGLHGDLVLLHPESVSHPDQLSLCLVGEE